MNIATLFSATFPEYAHRVYCTLTSSCIHGKQPSRIYCNGTLGAAIPCIKVYQYKVDARIFFCSRASALSFWKSFISGY